MIKCKIFTWQNFDGGNSKWLWNGLDFRKLIELYCAENSIGIIKWTNQLSPFKNQGDGRDAYDHFVEVYCSDEKLKKIQSFIDNYLFIVYMSDYGHCYFKSKTSYLDEEGNEFNQPVQL